MQTFSDELTINRFSPDRPDLHEVLNSLDLFFPACPDRIIVDLHKLKKKFLENEDEITTHDQLFKMLTETSGRKDSKSATLKDFIVNIQQRKDELLMKFPVSFSTRVSVSKNDWGKSANVIIASFISRIGITLKGEFCQKLTTSG